MHWLATIGIGVLEFLFFAGWVGSALVLLLTSVEDVGTVFEREEPSTD